MTKKEQREWDELFGNAALSESQLIDKAILILVNQTSYISYRDLFKALFDNATGQVLNYTLNRIITELADDGIISVEETNGGLMQPPSKLFTITGKGIKLAKAPIKYFSHRPYTYYRWTGIIEAIFSKYLPIVISVFALVVSVATCNRTK